MLRADDIRNMEEGKFKGKVFTGKIESLYDVEIMRGDEVIYTCPMPRSWLHEYDVGYEGDIEIQAKYVYTLRKYLLDRNPHLPDIDSKEQLLTPAYIDRISAGTVEGYIAKEMPNFQILMLIHRGQKICSLRIGLQSITTMANHGDHKQFTLSDGGIAHIQKELRERLNMMRENENALLDEIDSIVPPRDRPTLTQEYIHSIVKGVIANLDTSTKTKHKMVLENEGKVVLNVGINMKDIETMDLIEGVTYQIILKQSGVIKLQKDFLKSINEAKEVEEESERMRNQFDLVQMLEMLSEVDTLKKEYEVLKDEKRLLVNPINEKMSVITAMVKEIRTKMKQESQKMRDNKNVSYENGIQLSCKVTRKSLRKSEKELEELFGDRAFEMVRQVKSEEILREEIGEDAFDQKKIKTTRVTLENEEINRGFRYTDK